MPRGRSAYQEFINVAVRWTLRDRIFIQSDRDLGSRDRDRMWLLAVLFRQTQG